MPKQTTNVFTHHKCGSTWLCWVLRSTLEYNGIEYSWSDYGDAIPDSDCRVSILQNSQYDVVEDHFSATNIHVIRNPLSVLASAYHSHRATHPTERWERLKDHRRLLRRSNETEGMLLTLAFLFSPQFCARTAGPFASLQGWDYDDDRVTTIRMEDAVLDPCGFVKQFFEISGLAGKMPPDVEHFRFENFTGRKVGEVDDQSHYRSGDPEGWRTELSPVVVDYVRQEFRPLLEKFYPEALSDSVHVDMSKRYRRVKLGRRTLDRLRREAHSQLARVYRS